MFCFAMKEEDFIPFELLYKENINISGIFAYSDDLMLEFLEK